MKPKLIHQEAMNYSFKAKEYYDQGDIIKAFNLYNKAAELESQIAEFYFDKPDLEPTRSLMIRSAAFLNIKAGQIENAKKFIFFGLLNLSDEGIKQQLNNALEVAVSFNNLNALDASKEYNYLNSLRMRSVHYVLEPVDWKFGHSVSLESIKNFSENYLKSLKAYAISKIKKALKIENELEKNINDKIGKMINPLVTNSSYGSFKFSVANDYLSRENETKELVDVKANIVSKFHNEIFTNPLDDESIKVIKEKYSDDEVNDIFRPLAKIKSVNTPYKIGYYDSDNFNKKYTSKIVNKQRQKLLTLIQISQEDIGELESSITHKRSSEGGKMRKTTILKEQLKKYEFEIKTKQIETNDIAPIILNEEIVLNVLFNSDIGFTISFEDFAVEYTDTQYEKTLKGFYTLFYNKIIELLKTKNKNDKEQTDWKIIENLVGNPEALLG